MLRVVRTPSAQRDVSELVASIAGDNLAAALKMVDQIDNVIDKLRAFPKLGQTAEEVGAGLRRTSVAPYAIYYRILGDTIDFDRVVHGARDVDRVFE